MLELQSVSTRPAHLSVPICLQILTTRLLDLIFTEKVVKVVHFQLQPADHPY